MIYFTTVKKSIIFLYTSNKKSENKIKKTIPLIIASKKKKTKKNLIKVVPSLYTVKYKTLPRAISKQLKKWRVVLHSRVGNHNIITMRILQK